MTITFTQLVSSSFSTVSGSGSIWYASPTASFTPSDNSLLICTIHALSASGSVAQSWTVTDSLGGTWTHQFSQDQGSTNFATAVHIFTRPVTTGASMTVQAYNSNISIYADSDSNCTKVCQVTGHDAVGTLIGLTAGYVGVSASPISFSLGGTSSSNSGVFAACDCDGNFGDPVVDAGSGFTLLSKTVGGNSGGWHRHTTEYEVGAVSTINFGAPGTSTSTGYCFAAMEVKAAPPPPPLDGVSVAAYRAVSLRKVRAAHSGPCLRISRSSDNTEQDIGFSSGVIDTAAALTFVGAGNGRVVTWYDQSSNGRNWTQSAANAPYLIVGGALVTKNGKPAVTNNADFTKNLAGTNVVVSPFTLLGVWSHVGSSTYGSGIYDGGASPSGTIVFGTGFTGDNTRQAFSWYGNSNDGPSTTAISNTGGMIAGGMKFAASGDFKFFLNGSTDGSDTVAFPFSFVNNGTAALFAQAPGCTPLDSQVQEFIEFDAALSDADATTLSRAQRNAWLGITRVQGGFAPSTGAVTGSSYAVTISAVGSGNAICGYVSWDDLQGATLTSVTDNQGNSYNLESQIIDTADNQRAQAFSRTNITNGPVTITANFSTGTDYRAIVVDEFSGISILSSDERDIHGGQYQATPGTSTNAISSGSFTTTVNGDLLYGATMGVAAASNGSSFAAGASIPVTDYALQSEYRVQTTAGSGTAATFTQGSANPRVTFLIALKPAGADLCTGGLPFANSFYGVSYEAASAFDNNFTTSKWISTDAVTTPVDVWAVNQLSSSATVVSYQLTSGDDAPERDPQDWVLQGSNNGSTWTVLDERVGELFSGRGVTKTYDFSNGVSYAYYRLYVTRLANLTAYFQIAEIRLWTGASGTGTNVALGGTLTSSDNYPGQAVGLAFDNSNSTKWLALANITAGAAFWSIGYRFASAVAINKYQITSGDDAPERDPQDWKLQCSDDSFTWVDADTRTAEDFPSRLQTRSFSFTNAVGSKRYWRLKITKRGDNATSGAYVQIVEIEMESAAVTAAATLTASNLTNSAPVLGAPALPAPLYLYDYEIDFGLNAFASADKIVVCSQRPTTYTEANATYKLGEKAFAGGAVATIWNTSDQVSMTVSGGGLIATCNSGPPFVNGARVTSAVPASGKRVFDLTYNGADPTGSNAVCGFSKTGVTFAHVGSGAAYDEFVLVLENAGNFSRIQDFTAWYPGDNTSAPASIPNPTSYTARWYCDLTANKIYLEVNFGSGFVKMFGMDANAGTGGWTPPTSITGGNYWITSEVNTVGSSWTLNPTPTGIYAGWSTWDTSGGGSAPWTWNSADKNANVALSGGDLVASGVSADADTSVRGTVSALTGKYYWEVVVTNKSTSHMGVGIGNAAADLSFWMGSGSNNGLMAYNGFSQWSAFGTSSGATPTYTTGDRLGIAWDATAELIWITKNGTTWYGSTSAGNPSAGTNGFDYSALNAGPYFPVVTVGFVGGAADVATLVPAAANWVYTPPSGFGQLAAGGITRVQGNGTYSATSSTSIATTLSAAVGIGNTVCGIVSWENNGVNLTSVTDNQGNSYNIETRAVSPGNDQFTTAFSRSNIINAPTVITANFSGNTGYHGIVVDEFSGTSKASADERDGTAHGGQSQPFPGTGTDGITSGNFTTTTNGDLLYGCTIGVVNVVAGTGFVLGTAMPITDYALQSEYRTQTTAGAGTAATFTQSVAVDHETFLIAIKPAAGAGGGVIASGPVAASPTGRKVTTAAVSGGTVSANGTPSHWAIIDTVNSRLLAAGLMTGAVPVTTSDTWTLSAMTINVPSEVA